MCVCGGEGSVFRRNHIEMCQGGALHAGHVTVEGCYDVRGGESGPLHVCVVCVCVCV